MWNITNCIYIIMFHWYEYEISKKLLKVIYRYNIFSFQTDYIKKFEYSVEIHNLITKDGYILTTFRIPCRKRCNESNESVVLLGHSLLGNCESFLLLAGDSLPFLLADNGYDIWMLNSRGTHYSRRHKYLGNGEEYWNFRWIFLFIFFYIGIIYVY